jgi:hypothetical protein
MTASAQPAAPSIYPEVDWGGARALMQDKIIDSQHAELTLETFSMALQTHRSSTVEASVRDLNERLADAIWSKLLGQDDADLLLVHPSSHDGMIWLCAIRLFGKSWRADAVEVQRPRGINTDFTILNTGDQEQNILAAYRFFQGTFPEWMQYAKPERSPCLLRVKVDPKELWVLKFPLGFFAQLKLSGFEQYSGCQWIVTDRTVFATVAAQKAAERDIADTKTFLCDTQIVVNTYTEHQRSGSASILTKGYELIEEILKQFAAVSFGRDTAALRWTFNPPPVLLNEILLSPSTRFLFADFEAKDNVWHIGDGVHRCYQACCHATHNPSESRFDLGPFQSKLAHILLMRIYHCNSIYDPFKPRLGPAGEDTLAGKLLATGATFVEGSLSEEPALDYICELLNLLLGRSDLRTIIWGRSIVGLCDLGSFLTRANALLALRGCPALAMP